MQRPRILLNFAITADGKVSTAKFTPTGFTSARDKRRLLEIRALGDALMVGRNTLRIDRMSMGLPDEKLRQTRIRRGQSEYPIRVIITNSGDLSLNLNVFNHRFSPIVIYSTTRMPPTSQTALGARAELHLSPDDRVNLAQVLNDLYITHKVRTIVCEGGPGLAKSLAELNVIDELFLTIAPILSGGSGAPGILGVPDTFLPSTRFFRIESKKVEAGECYVHYVAD